MGNHLGFVSPSPLPKSIPADRFFLAKKKAHRVKAGQWFGLAAVILYACQPHEQTEQWADKIDLFQDLKNERLELTLYSSNGESQINLWPVLSKHS